MSLFRSLKGCGDPVNVQGQRFCLVPLRHGEDNGTGLSASAAVSLCFFAPKANSGRRGEEDLSWRVEACQCAVTAGSDYTITYLYHMCFKARPSRSPGTLQTLTNRLSSVKREGRKEFVSPRETHSVPFHFNHPTQQTAQYLNSAWPLPPES